MKISRVTILPAWGVYFLAIGIAFVLAVKTGVREYSWIIYFLLLILLFDLSLFIVSVIFPVKFLHSERVCQETISEGEFLTVKISVRNDSQIPLFFCVVYDFFECALERYPRMVAICHLFPKKRVSQIVSIRCMLRGKYRLGPLRIVVRDPLGFFLFEKKTSLEQIVYVSVKPFFIRNLGPLTRGNVPWFGIETCAASGDDHEFFGVREYKAGDPVKRIHWLTTARRSKLVVREYQRVSFYQASILFVLNQSENVGIGKDSLSEAIIRIAASIVQYCTDHSISFSVLAHAGRMRYFPSSKGIKYKEELFKFFAEALPKSRVSLQEFCKINKERVPPHSSVFLIISDKNIDSVREIAELKALDVSLTVYVLVSATFGAGENDSAAIEKHKQYCAAMISSLGMRGIFFHHGDSFEEQFL